MNSKEYKTLSEAYENVYLKEQTLEFCNEFIFDTQEESQYFVDKLFEDEELAVEFFDDVAEYVQDIQLHEDAYITEVRSALIKKGLQVAGGLLKKTTPQLKGLSAKTLTKQGYQAGGLTQAGKLLGKTNKPALATQTQAIRTARSAKAATPQENPGKYLNMLQQKRAAKALPAAGETTAGTFKATAERGLARDKAAREGLSNVLDTFSKGLGGFIRRGSAQDKLARAARGTKGTGVKIGQPGVTSIKMGKVQAPQQKPAPIPEFPVSKSTTMGKVQAPQQPVAPKPDWESVRTTKMGKPQGPQQPSAPIPQWGGSKQAQDIKRFNQLNKGGVIGGTATKKTPRPAFGPEAGPSPVDTAVDRAFKGGPLAKIDKPSDRVIAAQAKLAKAAKGTKGVGPATPVGAGGGALTTTSKTSTSLPSKVAAAQAKLSAAAKGNKGVGPATPVGAGGGALVKAATPSKGTSGAKAVSTPTPVASASTSKTGVKGGKTALAVLGGAVAGLGIGLGARKGEDNATKSEPVKSPTSSAPAPSSPSKPSGGPRSSAPSSPSKPSGGPRSSAPSAPSKPSGGQKPPKPSATSTTAPSGPKPMTKIDKDVEELMSMRARSLDRQGRAKEAEELRANIEKKYGGRS